MAITDTPNVVSPGAIPGVGDLSKVKKSADFLPIMANLGQAKASADANVAAANYDLNLAQQEAKADEKAREAQDLQTKATEIRQQIDASPMPDFKPTKEDATSLGQLFSLVATFGVMLGGGGKLASVGALNAMGGMMEGWRQGRADLFNKEKAEYDKQVTKVKAFHEQLQKDFQQYQKLRAVDREAAELKKAEIIARSGRTSVLGAALEKGRVDVAANIVDASQKIVAKTEQEQAALARVQMQISAANKRAELDRLARAEQAKLQRKSQEQIAEARAKAKGEGKTIQSALLSGRAENIREAFVQAAQDVVNITYLPEDTVLGSFAGLSGTSGKSLTEGLTSTFARSVTEEDQRALQQLTAGIEGHLAFALGGGYAASASAARMAQYKEQIPREGDSGYNAALFLARVRQEMNILAENFPSKPGASPEMTEAVTKYNNLVNDAIPFTVQEVLQARGRPKAAAGGDKFVAGKEYTDAKGNKARYLGDGKWEEVK